MGGALVEILLRKDGAGATGASVFINELFDLGLRQALSRASLADEAEELGKMEAAYLAGPLRSVDVQGLADRARKTERVEITTMTSSKGLEFDTVLILGVDEGQVPFFSSVNNGELMAEERRKLYVSVTRARNRVSIFYSGFVQWSTGRVGRDGPSRFLREMRLV
jgi:DNA helicase-2/ATP-dependent DNA helicase PcrA